MTSICSFIKEKHIKLCPICYEEIGKQMSEGNYYTRCQDGKYNSDMAEECKHYVCVPCAQTLYNNLREEGCGGEVKCPLCRENWTLWLLTHYEDESESESEDEDSDEETTSS